jgi:hypothetical protein
MAPTPPPPRLASIKPATLVPDGRAVLSVQLEEGAAHPLPTPGLRHWLVFDDGRGWRERAELRRKPAGRAGFSVRVPKYRRSLHRRSEVAVTLETVVSQGGRPRVLSSAPAQVAFTAAKSRRGQRVTFQRLGAEGLAYAELEEVLEVLAGAGLAVDSVSGEVDPPPEEAWALEELLASCPCAPLPLPALSPAELEALVADLQAGPELPGDLLASPGPTVASIKRGDMIEYRAGEGAGELWFRVEVTSKGKATGRNRSYLNLRYADGSEGGVHIDQHHWRFALQAAPACGALAEQGNLPPGEALRPPGRGVRARKRASLEMGGLEDSLSSMALELGPLGPEGLTSFTGIRV